MASLSSSTSRGRPPTLSFPALHLGSFHTLSPESFPSPASPTRISPISPLGPTRDGSPTRSGFGWDARRDPPGSSGVPPDGTSGHDRAGDPSLRPSSSRSRLGPTRTRTDGSRSPKRPPVTDPYLPPPPNISLSPLPALSPISPIAFHSPSGRPIDINLGSPLPISTTGRSPSWVTGSSTSPRTRPLDLPSTRGRLPGPPLSINIPSPLTPSSSINKNGPPSPAVLRHSPIPRRRTLVEPGKAASSALPMKVTDMTGTLTPPRDGSPDVALRRSSLDLQPIAMPVAKSHPEFDLSLADTEGSHRRLAKISSTTNLKRISPVSPTKKRSLPKPPAGEHGLDAQPSIPSLRSLLNSIPAGAQPSAVVSSHTPTASATWPPLSTPRVPLAVPDTVQRRNAAQARQHAQHQSLAQKHQTTNSASSLPAVGGLADAGPYPSSPAPLPRQRDASGQTLGSVGIGRPIQAGPSRPGPKPGLQSEEVCLECMMRDQDLADVGVQGEGAWDRGSDADWDEKRWREEALLRSMSTGSMMSSVPSLDHSSDSGSEDISTTSPPSTGHSLEDVTARQRTAMRRRAREAKRISRRELDRRVIKEIGWRGFRWEEGVPGEGGMPTRFRGTRGGALTESGIKAFPSASQHRYDSLHVYLHYQAILIREIHLEAQRIGHYPEPGDVPVSTSAGEDSVNVIAGPRTSSIAWEGRHARDLSAHMRGAFDSLSRAPKLSLVRPSPSSPADLSTTATGRHVPLPLIRPFTQYDPDRKQGIPVQRSPIPIDRETRGFNGNDVMRRSGRVDDDWLEEEDELWSPDAPLNGSIRPFSFAVRAGATAAKGSSDGHGRRSLWGRWGGSVTSLFAGSQGGSGSMMDMHLGLDNDRREYPMSEKVPDHPRSVSLVSPLRPPFFGGRESRASSIDGDRDRSSRVPKSISSSRLSQMLVNETDEEVTSTKRKGFKGYFKRMKLKSYQSGRANTSEPTSPGDEDFLDLGAPLAPPPPISALVRGDRRQQRDRGDSVSSVQTDASAPAAGGAKRYSGSIPPGLRNASASQTDKPFDGRQSISPTSSRFVTSGPRRESYVSVHNRDRRQSATIDELSDGTDRRGSAVEVLSAGRFHASPEPGALFEEHGYTPRSGIGANHTHVSPHFPTFPPVASRPHNKTTSSLSASTFIETPPPVTMSTPFFEQRHQDTVKAPFGSLSPNRFKNLPPLPPPGDPRAQYTASPDLNGTSFPEQLDFSSATGYDRTPRNPSRPSTGPSPRSGYVSRAGERYLDPQPRSSCDTGDRPSRRAPEVSPRMAQSMYVQPSAAGSTGSFGRFMAVSAKRHEAGTPIDLGDGKSVRGKKGFRGLFGRPARVR